MSEPDLVSLGIAVDIIHAPVGMAQAQGDIRVTEQYPAGRDRIASSGQVGGAESAVLQRSELGVFYACGAKILDLLDARGQEMVVQDRLKPSETFQAHDFFTV
jgi:hypothetical protein